MNKREFIAGTAALACAGREAAACETSATAPAASRLRRRPDLAADPGLAAWQGYLGERFEARLTAGRATLRLAEVRPQPAQPHTEQFTLVFDAPAGIPARAGLVHLRHANGQRVAVYLEPGRQRLVAHFNRLA